MKIFLILLLVCSCSCIKYVSDVGVISSASANFADLMIKINGDICKNGSGQLGLCIMNIRRGSDLSISLDSLPYNYTFVLDCTDFINSDSSYSVLSNTAFNIKIPSSKFGSESVFNCIFSVVKENSISMFASGRFFVFSDKYEKIEDIYKIEQNKQEYLNLGEHSFLSVEDNGKVNHQKPLVKYTGQKIFSESEAGRRVYYGY